MADQDEHLHAIQRVREMVTASWTSHALYLAAKLEIPEMVASAPKSSDEIATAIGCHPEATFRFLRALASVGILTESGPKTFALGPLGAPLRRGVPGSVQQLTVWYGEFVRPVWDRMLTGLQTGRVVFPDVYGSEMWDWFKTNPGPSGVFNEAMGATEWRDQSALADAYDFAPVKLLVDVGGGQGTMLAAILRAHREMKGVLYDLPAALEGAERHLEDAGVKERCTITVGSCFDPLPPGGDVYLYSSVLHLLDDERGDVAMTRAREALPPNGRVLIIDRVLPPGDTPYFGKFLDLTMLVMLGGRERSEAEFGALFERNGLRLERVIPLPFFAAGIGLSIVVGERA